MNYQHYLDIAAECAEFSTYTGPNPVQLGCVAVYHGTILAKGSNSDKTHTRQAKYNYLRYSAQTAHYYPPKGHAEMGVLSRIKYLDIDFSKVTLFIYRKHKDGTPALARPCVSCEKAIRDLRIGRVVYSTDDGYAIEKFVYSKE